MTLPQYMLPALLLAVTLPRPIPPLTAHLAPGYYKNAHGCILSSRPRPAASPLAPSDPRVRAGFRDNSAGYYAYVGHYEVSQGNYAAAISAYRRALQTTTVQQFESDAAYVLPLSIAYFRAHQIHAAKTEWRMLLSRSSAQPIDGLTSAAIAQRYHDALVSFALSPPPFNSVSFGDSGAAYNLQRGLNAAANGNIAAAKRFLGFSLECSSMFQLPHLALGIIAAMGQNLAVARHEWLATLEGWDPSPEAQITTAQFDAIRLLLRFD